MYSLRHSDLNMTVFMCRNTQTFRHFNKSNNILYSPQRNINSSLTYLKDSGRVTALTLLNLPPNSPVPLIRIYLPITPPHKFAFMNIAGLLSSLFPYNHA